MILPKEKLKVHFKKHLNFYDEDVATILEYFHPRKLVKKEFFLKEGNIPKYEGFITNGCLRQYILDTNGKEHTLHFAIEDWWVSDIYSFLHQTPATINIQAIEESELLVISKTDKTHLFKEVPTMERLFRIMTQKSQAALQRRMVDNLMKTADERYLDYVAKYPHIASRLTNIQMASYLGISHEFLSKIKKRLREI